MPKLVQIYLEFIFLTDVTDEMIQMPSGPGGDSPAQNAESIKIEEHNPPQVNLRKCLKNPKKTTQLAHFQVKFSLNSTRSAFSLHIQVQNLKLQINDIFWNVSTLFTLKIKSEMIIHFPFLDFYPIQLLFNIYL